MASCNNAGATFLVIGGGLTIHSVELIFRQRKLQNVSPIVEILIKLLASYPLTYSLSEVQAFIGVENEAVH